jgi:hypothetical protein
MVASWAGREKTRVFKLDRPEKRDQEDDYFSLLAFACSTISSYPVNPVDPV